MNLDINLTTVISSGVVAIIVSAFTFVGNRYTKRILDRIERQLGIDPDESKPKDKNSKKDSNKE